MAGRSDMRKIVHLCPCANWFYYVPGASSPSQVSRVAAWATLDDGTTTGLLAQAGRPSDGLPPRLEPVSPHAGGVFRHLSELPVTLRPTIEPL